MHLEVTMTKLVPVPPHEEEAFRELLAELNLNRAEFKLELTEHPPATFGPRVKTIKVIWTGVVEANYGAAEATSWVDQFRANWDDGLIPGILEEKGRPIPVPHSA